MRQKSKEKIKTVFLELLKEKSIRDITVKEIVSLCKVNRNSFYYYYKGISDLVEEMIMESASSIIQTTADFYNGEQCIRELANWGIEYKDVLLNIYHSAERETFEKSLWALSEKGVQQYFKALHGDLHLSQEEYTAATEFMKCLTFGEVIDWLESDMEKDICQSYATFKVLVSRMIQYRGESKF